MTKLFQRVLSKLIQPLGLHVITKRQKDACPSYSRLDRIPSINTVIDVGVGDQGSPFLYSRFKNAFFISVDPLEEARTIVNVCLPTERSMFFQTALGSNAGYTTIEISKKASRSSLLVRRNYDTNSSPQQTRRIQLRTLDSIVEEVTTIRGDLGRPILLKIDTEGFEMEVLRGSSETLEMISYALLEAPLRQRFKGNSYTLSELVRFMSDRDFEAVQVLKAGNNTVDILFCRRNDELRLT